MGFVLLLLAVLVSEGVSVRIWGPAEVRVRNGTTNVTLVCVGRGLLEWVYGDSAVIEGGHTHLPRPGLLVFSHVTTADAGLYTCTNKSSSQSVSLLVWNNDGDNHLNEDTVRSAAIGGVIGVGVVFIVIAMAICAIVACVFQKEKVRYRDRDEMDYEIKEEYVATLNMDALETLSPDVRAHIDLDFLAQLTNTSPERLEKYRPNLSDSTESNNNNNDSIRGSQISLASLHFEMNRPGKLPDSFPITPSRRTTSLITTPTSPSPSLRHQIVATMDSRQEGGRQNFLRMLMLVESADHHGSTHSLNAI